MIKETVKLKFIVKGGKDNDGLSHSTMVYQLSTSVFGLGHTKENWNIYNSNHNKKFTFLKKRF